MTEAFAQPGLYEELTSVSDTFQSFNCCSLEPQESVFISSAEAGWEIIKTDAGQDQLPDYGAMRASGQLAFWDDPEEDIY